MILPAMFTFGGTDESRLQSWLIVILWQMLSKPANEPHPALSKYGLVSPDQIYGSCISHELSSPGHRYALKAYITSTVDQ